MKKIINNKKIIRAILSIIVILSMFIVPGLLNNFLYFLGIHNNNISSLICLLIYGSLLILIYLKEIKEEFFIFKKDFKNCLDTGFKYWMLGLFLMIVSNVIINLIIFKGKIATNEELNRQEMLLHPFFTMISAVLFAPILEELIFRKSLDKIFRPLTYVLLSGILFGFAHTIADLSNPLNLLYIIPYGSLGASFAIMNYKTKTIFTSIMIHTLHNLLTCTLLLIVL